MARLTRSDGHERNRRGSARRDPTPGSGNGPRADGSGRRNGKKAQRQNRAKNGANGAHIGLPRDVLVKHSILPIERRNGHLVLAVADESKVAVAHELAGSIGCEAQIVSQTREAVQNGLVEAYFREDEHQIVWGHAERDRDLSASRLLTFGQMVAALAILAGIIAGLVVNALATIIILVGFVTAFYLVSIAYKSWLAARALSRPCEVPVTEEELRALDDVDLPVYTLILPVYHEAAVLPDLIASIEALDYDKDKLDVKLLIEPDDIETAEALTKLSLPPYIQKLVVPPGGPKGKPKACNYALAHARGDYCVIYDAEDRPEPHQLKKAIIAFAKGGPERGCVQAKLGYYNADQNLLTRWFTIEYATWFDLYLPGLNSLAAPIPLGGTSNHFRIDLLREVGAWDPFNVTEDADLGTRLGRLGYRTDVVDSTTFEEANSQLVNWIRQRSRWVKGYIITWLVHMRNPFRLIRQLGVGGFLAFQIMVLGTFLAYFVNPFFWALVAGWYLTNWGAIEAIYPAPLFHIGLFALFMGNAMFIYLGVLSCLRREYYQGAKYALLMPFYWLLMSVAAWKALAQLILRPYYWEKTKHGLAPEPSRQTGRVTQ